MIEMSLELRLLPLALAALETPSISTTSGGSISIESRFKDVEILQEALKKLQFESKHIIKGIDQPKTESVVVRNSTLAFSAIRNTNENFLIIFPPGSQQSNCENIMAEISKEYGRILQRKVVQRIERDAASSGFRLASKNVNSDNSVTVTLGLI